jgi:hypothetical protein
VLDALPKDFFGMPQPLHAFLHWNLNTMPESKLRQNRFYQPRIETITKGLRPEDRKRLAEREAEVAEILQPFINAARDLEGSGSHPEQGSEFRAAAWALPIRLPQDVVNM